MSNLSHFVSPCGREIVVFFLEILSNLFIPKLACKLAVLLSVLLTGICIAFRSIATQQLRTINFCMSTGSVLQQSVQFLKNLNLLVIPLVFNLIPIKYVTVFHLPTLTAYLSHFQTKVQVYHGTVHCVFVCFSISYFDSYDRSIYWYKIIKLYGHTQLSSYQKYQLYFQLHVSAHIQSHLQASLRIGQSKNNCTYKPPAWNSRPYRIHTHTHTHTRTHTHHRFKITLPNTDQTHDKISVNHYE